MDHSAAADEPLFWFYVFSKEQNLLIAAFFDLIDSFYGNLPMT